MLVLGTTILRDYWHFNAIDDIEETRQRTESKHRTTLTTNNRNGTKQNNLTHKMQHSTTVTTNIEVHGTHQAGTRATVQLPQLALATGAVLWRRGLERQEGWGRQRGRRLL